MSHQQNLTVKADFDTDLPSWWHGGYDDLLLKHLGLGDFHIDDLKDEMRLMSETAMPGFNKVQRYDFDLDFVIQQTARITSMSPQQARTRVLGHNFVELESSEHSKFDFLCDFCPRRRKVYMTMFGNLSPYGSIRPGCCGSGTILMLVVDPRSTLPAHRRMRAVMTGVAPSSRAPRSQTEQDIQEMYTSRHNAFAQWHRLKNTSTEGKSYEQVVNIRAEMHRTYNQIMEDGGMFICSVGSILHPELALPEKHRLTELRESKEDLEDGGRNPMQYEYTELVRRQGGLSLGNDSEIVDLRGEGNDNDDSEEN